MLSYSAIPADCGYIMSLADMKVVSIVQTDISKRDFLDRSGQTASLGYAGRRVEFSHQPENRFLGDLA